MFILIFAPRTLSSSPAGTWYIDEAATWIVGVLVLASVVWFFVRRYLRARALRRRPRRGNNRSLKRTAKLKRELSSRYLRPGFSGNIHAVGLGMLGSEYCIQVFINDVNGELWTGSGAAPLPDNYRGVPIVRIEMPMAGFLSDDSLNSLETANKYSHGIRERQEVIVGGISGAHTNLTRQSGTIGYFCTRKSKLPRRKEIHLLSNAHVFADLRKGTVDQSDLIMQPSPGEAASNRPIGTLVNFSTLKFDGDLSEPNHVDAAVAKLWAPLAHKPLIPWIGAVMGYVESKDVEIGEAVRKFGRTTGYTEGQVFSIYLDIWIRYDRTGRSAFFQDQFLIEPTLPKFEKFVSGGDSGSLLVDANHNAIGLIFAGMAELPDAVRAAPDTTEVAENRSAADRPKRIESYGVANPIREVLDWLKIELLM